MFEKILIPISSEFFPHKAMEKAVKFSEYFGANIEVLYIVEKKVEDKIQKASEYVRTETQIEEMEEEISKAKKEEFDNLMGEWEGKFSESVVFTTKVVQGNYSEEIAQELTRFEADLIILETEENSVLDYKLFYQKSDTPILIIR